MGKGVKTEKYNEGLLKGKKVFLIGALPIIFFLILVSLSAYYISNYANKMTVNKDPDVCNAVRRAYAGSVRSNWPCDIADRGDYFLVTFNQSANTGGVAALMSFKYEKSTKVVIPAISIN